MRQDPRATTWLKRTGVGAMALALFGTTVITGQSALAAPETDIEDQTVITTADTEWKFLDDGSDPAAGLSSLNAWTENDFDDSTWKNAKGSFGAKNGSLGAVGPYTPKTLLNHYLPEQGKTTVPTYFFRTSFDLEAGQADQYVELSGEATYDDALVIWVNGTKVAGFLDDRLTGENNQEYAGSSNGDPVTSTFRIPADVLVDGENTVAVSLHQDREVSSDIYLDFPELSLHTTEHHEPPSRVILTPTETPETSQYVSWLGGIANEETGVVEIRETAGTEVRSIDARFVDRVNNNPLPHFSAELTGLTPATSYTYRVGNAGSYSPWYTFKTADPNAKNFQYIYFGDAQIGLDTTWPKVVKQAMAAAPNIVGSVHAGDLINTGSNETEWTNWFKGMKDSGATTNVMAAPGNHEYSGDNKLLAWKANFEYPGNNPSVETAGELAKLTVGDTPQAIQYRALFEHWTEFAKETVYFTDYQGVRFITINATRSTGFLVPDNLPACEGSDCPAGNVSSLWVQFQAAWLDHILEDSDSKWNVVTFHQPVYSASAGRNEPVLREHWVPVFQKHNIDLVQMGHDHVYARGYHNSNTTEHEGVTDGPVYVVSNSGAKHYDLAPAADNVWTQNDATQVLRGRGFTTYQIIDVTEDALTYKSYVAEKTSTSTTDLAVGDLWDEFTVTKDEAGTKWVTEAGVKAPEEAEPALAVDVNTSVRCLAGKATLTVAATNGEAGPISLKIVSDFGTKQFNKVNSGKKGTAAFSTRQAELAEGTISVEASDGTTSSTQKVDFAATGC
ncbi:purple acid phosphatase family protein [Glutamicibacter ardleyensis]|uniref:Metallophosphoesterase n=3 Tax=Glutamicibacter arilaitensis TaxID=256701 RepID=A0A2N7S7B7_9MICC|nr:metallophosphoesterase [Glutamicibacter arilaitensis]HCH47006.1 metallophosphoesterase [Glutamicibacter sp.]HCJ55130.1 metallophosphoesterase [Glutamicibacter sp.]HCM95476.1 metallophosphoesterase [Glutamicibacter sp.]